MAMDGLFNPIAAAFQEQGLQVTVPSHGFRQYFIVNANPPTLSVFQEGGEMFRAVI